MTADRELDLARKHSRLLAPVKRIRRLGLAVENHVLPS